MGLQNNGGMAQRIGFLLCTLGCSVVVLMQAPVGEAAPTGKLAPERRDKNEWKQAINEWQANENQVGLTQVPR
eukprot:COSAG02_NODE_4231_length_5608_cov_74.214376_5_plen_73_part_00